MPVLHLISKSPDTSSALADCLRACGEDAVIVLIEDAVNAALRGGTWRAALAGHTVHALAEDCAARGLSNHIADSVERIDYAGFVQLCCEHTPIVSWY